MSKLDRAIEAHTEGKSNLAQRINAIGDAKLTRFFAEALEELKDAATAPAPGHKRAKDAPAGEEAKEE